MWVIIPLQAFVILNRRHLLDSPVKLVFCGLCPFDKVGVFGYFHTVVLLSLISIMTVKQNNAFLLTCYFINYRMS